MLSIHLLSFVHVFAYRDHLLVAPSWLTSRHEVQKKWALHSCEVSTCQKRVIWTNPDAGYVPDKMVFAVQIDSCWCSLVALGIHSQVPETTVPETPVLHNELKIRGAILGDEVSRPLTPQLRTPAGRKVGFVADKVYQLPGGWDRGTSSTHSLGNVLGEVDTTKQKRIPS